MDSPNNIGSQVKRTQAVIMMVDDDPNICYAVARILGNEGYKTIVAPDGDTALELVEKEKPDIILLDIMNAG
jgi:DNA-binding response OmpR family regulator